MKEDEYLRDGITEDILTDLSKIKGLNVFPRTTVLAFRDQKATAADVCRQLRADYALEGSLRRAGNRLRINTQLVDAATGFPVWSERYDREMSDIFAVQDEIAHKIAEALRIKVTPQEQAELAAKPTENLQAYDLYLRGRSYARRRTTRDMDFALQMFENAVTLDPNFALAWAAIANGCAHAQYWSGPGGTYMERAQSASLRAVALAPDIPEVLISQGWILYAGGRYDDAVRLTRAAISRKRDCEGAYYLLLRALFASGKYDEVATLAEEAIEAAGTDYNVYIPIMNALGALGREDASGSSGSASCRLFENHLREVPEDARARILRGGMYAQEGRTDDAVRETNLAMTLRPNEATVLYNAACTFANLDKRAEAIDALRKAWDAGYKDAEWTRRDPDLASLHGDPEFEKLYPAPKGRELSRLGPSAAEDSREPRVESRRERRRSAPRPRAPSRRRRTRPSCSARAGRERSPPRRGRSRRRGSRPPRRPSARARGCRRRRSPCVRRRRGRTSSRTSRAATGSRDSARSCPRARAARRGPGRSAAARRGSRGRGTAGCSGRRRRGRRGRCRAGR